MRISDWSSDVCSSDLYPDFPSRLSHHRLNGIADEIDQHLLDLDAVRIDQSRRRVCSELMGNAQKLRVDKSTHARFVDHTGQILGTHLSVAAREQLMQVPYTLHRSTGHASRHVPHISP